MNHISKIENNLFLGSSFSVHPEIVKKLNITYIFHLGFEININDYNCKHEYFDLGDNLQSVDKMLKISDYIVKKIEMLINTETILVCCVAGKSRSASMIALYLHYKYPKLSYEEIIEQIKKVRDISINKAFSNAIKNKIDNCDLKK
jgi:protein-tyrosine phosphatase